MTNEPSSNNFNSLPLRIAFYLPQFAPIPENDAWYGRGFTEWTNVVKSRPLYDGHRQPEFPSDLGFYDLRVPETREHQARLARANGISGFCYYHYWFNGRRVMERTFNEVLTSGLPEFPFCLAWCNESWYKRWHDAHDEMLIEQTYSDTDDLNHIRWLIKAFKDPRYIYVHERPLLCVYVPEDLPDPERTMGLWQSECRLAGVPEPWTVGFETFQGTFLPITKGFDASAEFIPHGLDNFVVPIEKNKQFRRFEYKDVAHFYSQRPNPDWIRYPCIVPNWDNSPRRQNGNAVIISGSTPEAYAEWLERSLLEQRRQHGGNGVVFINAWNEWCEGAHLEPDSYWGTSYLEANRQVVENLSENISLEVTNSSAQSIPIDSGSLSLDERYESLFEKFIDLQNQKSAEVSMINSRIEDIKEHYETKLNDCFQQINDCAQQLDEARSAQLLPMQGYLAQVGEAKGLYPGGWMGPHLKVNLRTNRPLSALTIGAYLPPSTKRDLLAFVNGLLVATIEISTDGITVIEIPMDAKPHDEFELQLQVSTPYIAEGDSRELGVILVSVEARH